MSEISSNVGIIVTTLYTTPMYLTLAFLVVEWKNVTSVNRFKCALLAITPLVNLYSLTFLAKVVLKDNE